MSSLCGCLGVLQGDAQEGFQKSGQGGGVEVQGLQKAIHGDGGDRLSRQQDPPEQVGDGYLSHGGFG